MKRLLTILGLLGLALTCAVQGQINQSKLDLAGQLPVTMGLGTNRVVVAWLCVSNPTTGNFEPITQAGTTEANATIVKPVQGSNSVGGFTGFATVRPVVSTSAYASNNVISGVMTLTNAFRINGGSGSVGSLTIRDWYNQQIPLTVLFFGTSPVGTWTDRAAPEPGESLTNCWAYPVPTSSYQKINATNAIVTVSPVGLRVRNWSNTRDLWCAVIAQGSGTFTATNGFEIGVGVDQDVSTP